MASDGNHGMLIMGVIQQPWHSNVDDEINDTTATYVSVEASKLEV